MKQILSKTLPCLFSVLLVCFFCHAVYGQDLTLQGTITDENGEGLPGATVLIKDTDIGTVTDVDGHFTMKVPENRKNGSLVISFLGYVTEEIAINKRSSVIVSLKPSFETLQEVVVVGYGEQKKTNLTSAITTLDLTMKEGQPITNVSNALHGMTGLFVNLGNSMPGVDRARIRIRGVGTLNNNNPLVLVDGIEYSMDELNPQDIATITVLKDASAAIYGSRAANGVILVTTKKGSDKSKITYNNYFGIQQPTVLPDVIWDPIVYMKLKNEAVLNSGKSKPEYSDAEITEYQNGMKTDPYTYPANNWYDIALDNGIVNKHNLSFAGGGDKYKYRLALGYLDREGIIIGPNNNEQKYSIGLNTSAQVSDKLEIGLTLHGNYRTYTQPSYSNGSYWNYLSRALPIMPDRLADGTYGYPWVRTTGRNNWEHPRMLAVEGHWKKYIQRFLTTVYANYELPFDINYHVKVGIDKYDGFEERHVPQMVKYQAKTGEPYNWNNPATAPRVYNYDYNDLNVHFYNTLNWQHQFAQHHNVDIMVGASLDKFDHRNFNAQVTGYLDGSLTALNAGSERLSIAGSSTEDVLESYFGRVNYDFNEKYLFAATFRYDGSSRFAMDNRWGFFPSISAGWRIDKESFLSSSSVIDLLKIRASVGQMGNQAVSLYSYENSIELGQDYNFGGQLVAGAAANSYTDPTITWETTTTYDIGFDASVLNNSFNVTVDFYKKHTTDILRTVNLPAQIGNLSGPKRNLGVVDNTGVELSLQYQDKIGDVTYSVFGNASYNKNEVADLNGQILYGDGTNLPTITQEGDIMNAYYVLDAVGIFQSQEEVDAHAFQSKNTRPGYLKYRDVNKDKIINGDDRIVINASSIMPKYTFGFGLNVGYKGLALKADFQGVAGIKVYPSNNIAHPFNNGANATWEWVTDAWTSENPGARLPIVSESTGEKDNFRYSDFWLRDGSYLRLKNIQLSYTLPEEWLSKAKIDNLTVFVNAQNWITFSKYDDYDPESIVNASTIYHYPMLKTFSGGVNLTF